MMKKALLVVPCALVIGLAGVASAHVGIENVAQEVPDPSAMVMDGNDDDWGWFDDANAITEHFDSISGEIIPPDDWNAVWKTGWSRPPENMWYFFSRVQDDNLDRDNPDQKQLWQDDNLQITFDADHSSGPFLGENLDETANGQRYHITVLRQPGLAIANNCQLEFIDEPRLAWSSDIYEGDPTPFFEVAAEVLPAGSQHGATNVTLTYEFRCALWDDYGLSEEESIRHINEPFQILHYGPRQNDFDPDEDVTVQNMIVEGIRGDPNQDKEGDASPDWVLLPAAGGPTAVEDVSWARIKSHLRN
jgi:hypothetical protein